MISDGASALPPADRENLERHIYVGLAWHGHAAAQAIGLLKLVRRGVMESGEFAYGLRYLQDPQAQPLNPNHLPLQEAAFALSERRIRDGGALPLTLHDALPDSWGRRVLEVQQGRPLSDLEALLLTNDDRVGAMVFSETLPIRVNEPAATLLFLDALADASHRIEHGMTVAPQILQLLRGGASLGGARPKATFVHLGRRCIAKFASRADEFDMEVVEAATLTLARQCGITVPPFHVVPLAQGHALLLERFDRTGAVTATTATTAPIAREHRVHYLSCSALLNVPYASSGGSYVELAQTLRRISAQPVQDVTELFQRMVFNLVVGNSDDHVKNHGVLHQGKGLWRLAPAFDLVAQLDSHTGYQELAILPGRHASSLSLAREAAPHFGFSAPQADDLIAATARTVASLVDGVIQASGGDDRLAQRFSAFIKAQMQRIDD